MRHSRFNALYYVGVGLVLGTLLAMPGALAQSPCGDKTVRIGFAAAQYDFSDFFGQTDFGIRDTLDEADVKYNMLIKAATSGGADQPAQLQNHHVLLLLDLDYLISGPTQPPQMASAYKQAEKQGVPVFLLQFTESVVTEPPYNIDFMQMVGNTHVDAGEAIVQWAKENLKPGTKIAVLHGLAGSPITEGRSISAIPKFEAAGFEVVAQEHADFQRDIAFNKTRAIMTRNPDIGFIMGGSSAMGLGAVSALESLGRNGVTDVPVTGIGGTLEEISAMLGGHLRGTALRDPYQLGVEIAKAIILDCQGRAPEIQKSVAKPYIMLDSCEDIQKHISRRLFEIAGKGDEYPETCPK